MDSELASKIRALALASRCLARELRRLKSDRAAVQAEFSGPELERLVELARTILDPSGPKAGGRSNGAAKSTSKGRSPASRGAAQSNQREAAQPPAGRIDLLASRAPSDAHKLAILGHGTVLPIPELVGFLGTLGQTGVLKVETVKELFVIEFHTGFIVHGETSRAPIGQRLGDVLISHGAIERSALQRAREGTHNWRLGKLLLEKKLISRDALLAALRSQIQLLFCRLLREQAKCFTFWTGPPICAEQGVRLNTTSLLLEGARVRDEMDDGLRTLGGTRRREAS